MAATARPVSYARVAKAKASPQPAPTSFPLIAARQALQEQLVGQTVFLIDRNYLFNWFAWALHSDVPEQEKKRVHEAIRLAALKYGLAPGDCPFTT